MDVESKYKAELSRLRKKYEQQLGEYETQIETMTRTNTELGKANKALAARVKVADDLTVSLSLSLSLSLISSHYQH